MVRIDHASRVPTCAQSVSPRFFFFSSRRRHTRCSRDWSSDVCSSDLLALDARVLSEVLRRGVSLGKIMYGENYATLKVKTSALATDVRKLTDKIGTLLASPSPPDLVLKIGRAHV